MKKIHTFCYLACVSVMGCQSHSEDWAFQASGHIEATEVRVAAKVSGPILELAVEEGSRVDEGTFIARIDATQTEKERERARSLQAEAEAQLALLLAGSRKEEIRQAREQLSLLKAELAAAEADLARYEPLAERGSASRKLRDDVRTKVAVARHRAAAQEASLAMLISGPRAEEIAAARARLASTAAQVKVLEQVLADSIVLAPRTGTVTKKLAEEGEFVPAGVPLLVISDLSRPWLQVYVDEPRLAHLRLGQKVKVRLDGHPGWFEGTVSFVAEQAEFTPKNVQTPDERAEMVFKVKILLSNESGLLKPGMPADAYFPHHS